MYQPQWHCMPTPAPCLSAQACCPLSSSTGTLISVHDGSFRCHTALHNNSFCAVGDAHTTQRSMLASASPHTHLKPHPRSSTHGARLGSTVKLRAQAPLGRQVLLLQLARLGCLQTGIMRGGQHHLSGGRPLGRRSGRRSSSRASPQQPKHWHPVSADLLHCTLVARTLCAGQPAFAKP